MSRLRKASPSNRRGLIHDVCFGSWTIASPCRMRSIVSEICQCKCVRANTSQHSVFSLFCSSLHTENSQVYLNKHTYNGLRLQHGAYTASEVTQPIGGARARIVHGTSHPPSIKIHETSATRLLWLVLPHAQHELNTNIAAASLQK
jgi:predicted transcriptional regulator